MDGRVLAAKPSGVRDIAAGMAEGFRQLSGEGRVDFVVAGHDSSFDLVIPRRLFMHGGLPLAAARLRADRIFVPRQTKPFLSVVPTVPLFHDIGFFRAPNVYPGRSSIGVTTRIAARSRQALAVSQFTADEMADAGISTRVRALPIQAIHSLDWKPQTEEKYLLCIAVQEPHKNLERLVEAWDAADTLGCKLVICGRPGEASIALARAIASSPKTSAISVKAGLSDSEYLQLLEGCWGYIQPSLYEGLCIPALDLAAAGAPSAVSSSGNLGRVYQGAPSPQVFDAERTSDIVLSIESLIHDDDFRKKASRWNTANVQLTDWRKVAQDAITGMQ